MSRLAIIGAAEIVPRELERRLMSSVIQYPDAQSPLDATSEFDTVAILAPECIQPSSCEALLQAGKHLLLVPASSLTGSVVDRLAQVAAQRNVQWTISNPERWLPSRQVIRQKLDEGVLGSIGFLRLHSWSTASGSSPASSSARDTRLLCDLDLVQWLIGQTPETIYAIESTALQAYRQVHLGFAGGGMALIDAFDGLPSASGYRSLAIIGSMGAAYADDQQNVQLLFRAHDPTAFVADEGYAHWAAWIQSFIDDIEQRATLCDRLHAWRGALATYDGVRASIHSHEAISPVRL